MSIFIKKTDKRIIKNKPISDAYGQYNLGYVNEGDLYSNLGLRESSYLISGSWTYFEDGNKDLFTIVQHWENQNTTHRPDGLFQTVGGSLQVYSTRVVNIDTDPDGTYGSYYINDQISFYIYDSAPQGTFDLGADVNSTGNGEELAEAIATHYDTVGTNYNSLIGWINPNTPNLSSLGEILPDACSSDANVHNFTQCRAAVGALYVDNLLTGEEVTEPSINNPTLRSLYNDNFNFMETGTDEKHLIVIGRTRADSQIRISGSYSTVNDSTVMHIANDPRDRTYVKFRIPKTDLFQLWKHPNKSFLTYNKEYDTTGTRNSTYDALVNYRDTRGVTVPRVTVTSGIDSGSTFTGTNYEGPVNAIESINVAIIGPEFRPEFRILPLTQGGMYANWVNKNVEGWHCIDKTATNFGERRGLNPRFNMDFVGFPDKFYPEDSGSNNFFSSSMIDKISDIRPISFISSSYNVDLQGYYEGDTINDTKLRSLSSAPNTITLSLKFADSITDNVPQYVNFSEEPYNDFDYYYFVLDWDWLPSDDHWGPTETTPFVNFSRSENYFPKTSQEFQDLNFEDKFVLKDHDDTITHTYIEPGMKTIKVMVLTTTKDGGPNIPDSANWTNIYDNYIQAVDWKLMTIKIFLDDEGSVDVTNFQDLSGGEYTYLPYPDMLSLQVIDNDGSDVNGLSPSGTVYKSSHPTISGLSKDSIYVTSVKKIVAEDKFGPLEENEKSLAKRSLLLSPDGERNELGDYLGESDISQVRLFNKPYDMEMFLNISGSTIFDNDDDQTFGEQLEDVATGESEFHPWDDRNYWNLDGYPIVLNNDGTYNYQSFPEESPIGNIFIDEYDSFKESCLFELNCNKLNNSSFRDTSGNGCQGTLIGDFSVEKEYINQPASRDSYVKIPKLETDDGAF